MYFVYIIQSISSGKFYKGYSLDPLARLNQHNNNESRWTSGKGPWELVYIQSFSSKSKALKRERSVKKYSKNQVRDLIVSKLNELK